MVRTIVRRLAQRASQKAIQSNTENGGKEAMKEEEKRKERRRPYRKPQVEQVELVAEEQVLGLCKTLNEGGGIGVVAPDSCFFDGTCKEDGT